MANIIAVARAAGVSPMTVSRYFNSPDALRETTRERVRQAIEALHYVPNAAARSLVRGSSETIALLLPDITNPFFTTIARGVEDGALEAGYTLILGNSDENVSRERGHVESILRRRVDGVMLAPVEHSSLNSSLLERRRIPQVLIDRRLPLANADVLLSDSYAGGGMLTRHLLDEGFRRISFIGGRAGVSSLEDRLSGYRDTITAAGLEPDIHLGRYDMDSGDEIVTRLLAENALPEAIIAANNYVAVGAVQALRRQGLDAPRDVALACFGDIEIASLLDPFLTVVSHPAYDMGKAAVEMLLERLHGFAGPPRERILPVTLIVRRSSVRPR